MKKKRVTFLVGIFSIGALVLLVGVLYFLGSTTLFSKGDKYILYFNESVNGLNIGSPVKMRGVPIGNVSRILIDSRFDPNSHLIPVIVEIQPDRLRGIDGRVLDLSDPKVMKTQIEYGLRGKLQQLSFITGQIYIELDYSLAYKRLGEPVMRHYGDVQISEIPTVPSAMAQLSEVLIGLRDNLEEVDFKAIGDNVTELLVNLNLNLSGDRIGRAFGEAGELMTDLRTMLQGEEFRGLLQNLEETFRSARSIVAKLDDGVEPFAEEVKSFIAGARGMLAKMDIVMEELAEAAQPESGIRIGLTETMESVNRAAGALSRLLDFLERNPDALLKGRSE